MRRKTIRTEPDPPVIRGTVEQAGHDLCGHGGQEYAVAEEARGYDQAPDGAVRRAHPPQERALSGCPAVHGLSLR